MSEVSPPTGRRRPVADAAHTATVDRSATYRKITLRVMPLLVACYIVSFIDRTNIGIAQQGLQRDLGFDSAVYGLGVTLFFVGFILFEVPSSALLARIGARKTLARIMGSWGVVTVASMFVWSDVSFYVARFLLGVAEAGFFPGALYFLSRWYPSSRRTRMTAVFFAGVPVSGVLGSLASGAIMHAFGGLAGLADWQWLFLVEGIPPILLAVVVLLWLVDGPEKARWLNEREKAAVLADLAQDQRLKKAREKEAEAQSGLRLALRDRKVWILGICACGAYTLANAVSFWTPRIIADSGVGDVLNLGFFSALPPLVGIVVMLVVGRHSDRTLERRWHAAASWFIALLALVSLSMVGKSVALVVVLLTVLAAAHYAGLTVFYSIPSIYLSERSAATGIAVVTSMGSFAAAASPSLLGFIRRATGSLGLGLQVSAVVVLVAVAVLLAGVRARDLRERHHVSG